ncbi:MAG: putative glucarate transporter [Chlamydiae bacterium]|nr:putative glucarate transporter [Chlamydiota bacterium]
MNAKPNSNSFSKTSSKSWWVWAIAALFPMYQFMLQGSPSVMLPELIHDLGITLVEASFITTFFYYSYIIMQIPSGILVDLFGPRILLSVGSFLAGLACIIFSSCKLLWIAEFSRLIMGFVCSVGIVSVFLLITQWFEAKRFALLVGLTETLCMAGAALSTVLLSVSVTWWGWRRAIFLCGLLGIFISLLIVLIVHNKPGDSSWILKTHDRFSIKSEIKKLRVVTGRFQVWVSGVYMGLAFSIIPAFFSLWGIPFFMHKYHLSSTQAATINAFGLVGVGIGGPFLGWLSDRIKRRKIIMNISSFVTVVCFWIILKINTPIVLTVSLTFILGFACSSYVVAFALIKEILPQNVKGRAMGFANMLCLAIGAPVLQPIIAMLIKHSKNSQSVFRFALNPITIALALSFILTFFIKETYCKDSSVIESR